ncbi:response regulator transcription factor [Rhodocaloribacter sp.]
MFRQSSRNRRPYVLVGGRDREVVGRLSTALERAGFRVGQAYDEGEAMAKIMAEPPALLVLEAGGAREGGLEVCRRLRADERFRMIPILMLSDEARDQAPGLDAGADVFLTRPVATRVFVSQVFALLRSVRRYVTLPEVIEIYDLEIDRSRYVVYRKRGGTKEALHFPRQQFELLHFLAGQPGRVFTREELLEKLWERDELIGRTVDVHVRKIRARLGSEYIETVKGIGYRFREPLRRSRDARGR